MEIGLIKSKTIKIPSEIKRGYIFLGNNCGSWVSKMIKKVTHSEWSHAGIILDATDFEAYVLGAREKGVDITTLSDYIADDKYGFKIYSIEINQDIIDESLRKLTNEYFEKPYGYFQLLGFLIWYKLKDWFGIRLKRNPIEFWTVCSELNAIYLKQLCDNIEEVDDWDVDLVVPEDIFRLFEKYPNIFKQVFEKVI